MLMSRRLLGVLETNISCQHGTFHATDTSGIWIKASIATETNRRIVLRGSAQSINSALSSLQYLPDLEYSGEDTLTLNVTDFGNTGSQDSNVLSNSIFTSTIIAHIMAVNDKPSLTISKKIRHIYPLEDTKFLIQNAVTVHDFDLVSGEDKVEVLIEASMGNVSVNLTSYFVKAEGLNTKSVHLAGPVHLVAESLANGLTYIGDKDQNGADIIKFTAFAPNTKSAALEVEIIVDIQPVNDAPTITAPGSYSTVEDSETILSGIILSDVDANELFGSVVQASVSVNHGTISPGSYAGIRMVSDGIYRGGIVELQQAFKNLKYLPHENWYGMDTVAFTLNDLGNHGLGSAKNTTKLLQSASSRKMIHQKLLSP